MRSVRRSPPAARTRSAAGLTCAGAAFVAGARECLAAADRAAADAAAATGAVRGRLAVGVIVTTAAVDVPELLQRYRARHPEVRVVLRSGRSDELVAAIREGHLDIAFLGLPEGERPSGVETVALDHDRHALVVAAGHRLVGASRVMQGAGARGLGIALMPSAFLRPLAADDPELVLIPVADGPRRVEYLAWSRFNPSPATRAMLGVLGVSSPA
ncbi:LysR substrate-binding domain-containing protein [Streptomyces sp. S465]|uniref:LysR substrate-binding domain-containing protein n=1 Tax=Streptomyces sp. S465 TaxID=2979468 RepID=UPI0022A86CDC|nr:LysR substrate-binding domain-containing protein [Streptomyces sp. S465]WAP60229.1 LysR substrate-binding domain-containing protein [Streptomyces sp. S465]